MVHTYGGKIKCKIALVHQLSEERDSV